jgi:hypothetical protein
MQQFLLTLPAELAAACESFDAAASSSSVRRFRLIGLVALGLVACGELGPALPPGGEGHAADTFEDTPIATTVDFRSQVTRVFEPGQYFAAELKVEAPTFVKFAVTTSNGRDAQVHVVFPGKDAAVKLYSSDWVEVAQSVKIIVGYTGPAKASFTLSVEDRGPRTQRQPIEGAGGFYVSTWLRKLAPDPRNAVASWSDAVDAWLWRTTTAATVQSSRWGRDDYNLKDWHEYWESSSYPWIFFAGKPGVCWRMTTHENKVKDPETHRGSGDTNCDIKLRSLRPFLAATCGPAGTRGMADVFVWNQVPCSGSAPKPIRDR